ncbi:MAG: hypothetical protein A2033_01640 [Bacteroidetes bacterium GWA2_31_9]|nr:MAG: hypothetical protein A2033_01640 [Bacteroidetes bacterium GWA2_31_9]
MKHIIIFLLLYFSSGYSQSLIDNGSFEVNDKLNCPKSFRDIKGDWNIVLGENFTILPDKSQLCNNYHNNCQNLLIHIAPQNGNAYLMYQNRFTEITKFNDLFLIQTTLIASLQKGKEYKLELYIKLQNKGNAFDKTSKNDFKIFFSKFSFSSPDIRYALKENKLKYIPQIEFNDKADFKDYADWKLFSATFVADGGEQYMILGRHNTIESYKNVIVYIDNINLAEERKDFFNTKNFKVGDVLIIDNILFEINSKNITESSYNILDKVYNKLKEISSLNIEISGHTDNTGNEQINKELSENRAKSVHEYLVSKGIDPTCLKFKGYGGSKPIADNKTSEGRELNRRVEIKILEN